MTAKGRVRPVGTPESWLEHARSDLRLARLAVGQGVLPEQICFHAQQAVEKSLMSRGIFSSSSRCAANS